MIHGGFKRIGLFILASCQIVLIHGQDADKQGLNRKFTTRELKEDLKMLEDSLRLRHPALYRYQTVQQFRSGFAKASAAIGSVNSLSGFYNLTSSLASSVGDLHTTVELPDEYYAEIAARSLLIPFDIRIIDNKIYVISNNSNDSSITVGSRILRINDRPAELVIGEMKKYFSAEGSNQTFKIRRVEQRFAFLHYIAFGESKKIKLEILNESDKSISTSIDALPFAEIRLNREKNQRRFPAIKSLFVEEPFLSLSVNDKNKTAVLTIKWFQNDVLETAGLNFRKFIDSAFLRINEEKIKSLVIDIRNNGGGESSNAAYLFSWLTDQPFHFLYAMDTNRITFEGDSLSGLKYDFLPGLNKFRTSDSATDEQRFFGLKVQIPHENSYGGRLYVLIDGLTVSAAPQFAALVKLNKRGVLIGEEAPGALTGGSGRGYSYFRLPNTGLLVMISHYRLYLINPDSGSPDQCIRPDIPASKKTSDIILGKDVEMDLVQHMINKSVN